VRLEHQELEPFEPLIAVIRRMIFEYGLNSMISEGLIRNGSELEATIASSSSAHRRFVRACHYGYDLAQRRLVNTVVGYEDQIRRLESEVKDRRRARDKAGVSSALNLIRCLQQRQKVLRRLADSILYVLVSGKNWVLRRMSIHDQIPRIDSRTLSRTCEVATKLNRANRLTFSLVSDLTTCVHIGDLVEVSFEAGRTAQWRIVELKDGEVNEKLIRKMDELGDSPSRVDVEASTAALDHNSAAQFKRMLRQKQRESQFNQIVRTDVGIDSKTQFEMRLTDSIQVEDYFEAIRRCIDKLEQEPIAAAKLQGGFSIIAVRE
jgi:hypothetical protein